MRKSISTEIPPKYYDFGYTKQICFNVIERQTSEGITYEYNIIDVPSLTKGDIIKTLMHDVYSIDDEIALINNFNENPDKYKSDYVQYQQYRNECKIIADNILNDKPINNQKVSNIEIIMPEIYAIKHPVVGNPLFDQNVFDYRDNLLSWGCKIFRKDGNLICRILDSVHIDINDFLFIMSKEGGDIKNFNPYLKIHKDNIRNLVPKGLPNSDNKSHNRWDIWRNNNNPIEHLHNNFYYFKSTTFDEYLTGQQLLIIYNCDEVELVDKLPF